jgi:hypothetical protein
MVRKVWGGRRPFRLLADQDPAGMVKAELPEPKCPISKCQGRGYNGLTSASPSRSAEVFVSGRDTLRGAKAVDNGLKDTKWAPNPA